MEVKERETGGDPSHLAAKDSPSEELVRSAGHRVLLAHSWPAADESPPSLDRVRRIKGKADRVHPAHSPSYVVDPYRSTMAPLKVSNTQKIGGAILLCRPQPISYGFKTKSFRSNSWPWFRC